MTIRRDKQPILQSPGRQERMHMGNSYNCAGRKWQMTWPRVCLASSIHRLNQNHHVTNHHVTSVGLDGSGCDSGSSITMQRLPTRVLGGTPGCQQRNWLLSTMPKAQGHSRHFQDPKKHLVHPSSPMFIPQDKGEISCVCFLFSAEE